MNAEHYLNKLDWFFITSYLLLLVIVTLKNRKLKISFENFAVDKKTLGWFIVFASLTASYIGPGYTIGIAEQGFIHGYLYIFILLPFTLQTILVGKFIAPKLRLYNGAYTVGDIMGYHYGILAKYLTGIISILFCAGIVGVIARVGGLMLDSFFGVPFDLGVIILTSIVIVYSIFGGIRAVINTDVFQFLILSFTVLALLFFLIKDVFFFEKNFLLFPEASIMSLSKVPLAGLLSLMIGFLLGETLVPPYANRAFVSKGTTQSKRGFVAAGIFSFFWFTICLVVGMYANYFLPFSTPEGAFMDAGLHLLPNGFKGLLIISIISIVMSSQDSYLNASAISFVRDIFQPINTTEADERLVLLARIVTFLVGIMGIIFAINAPGIIEALMINYALWAPSVVLPLILAILIPKKVTPLAGVTSMIAGILSVIIWKFVLINPFEIGEIIPGIIVNQITFWIVNPFGKKINYRLLQISNKTISHTTINKNLK
jgi:solute:Na+ symporter, SSS family